METRMGVQPRAEVRDYLAEERTFLAWIRTGVTLMTFGFVVARFGLFLEELHLSRNGSVLTLVRNGVYCGRGGHESLLDPTPSARGCGIEQRAIL